MTLDLYKKGRWILRYVQNDVFSIFVEFSKKERWILRYAQNDVFNNLINK